MNEWKRQTNKINQQTNEQISHTILFLIYKMVSWCSWLSHHFDVVRVPGSNPGGTIFYILNHTATTGEMPNRENTTGEGEVLCNVHNNNDFGCNLNKKKSVMMLLLRDTRIRRRRRRRRRRFFCLISITEYILCDYSFILIIQMNWRFEYQYIPYNPLSFFSLHFNEWTFSNLISYEYPYICRPL